MQRTRSSSALLQDNPKEAEEVEGDVVGGTPELDVDGPLMLA